MTCTKTKRVAKAAKDHICIDCYKLIPKGAPYYRMKCTVFFEGSAHSWESCFCAHCHYNNERHKGRFARFKPNCHHPVIGTHYGYIPGECVMQPEYDYCLICGVIV